MEKNTRRARALDDTRLLAFSFFFLSRRPKTAERALSATRGPLAATRVPLSGVRDFAASFRQKCVPPNWRRVIALAAYEACASRSARRFRLAGVQRNSRLRLCAGNFRERIKLAKWRSGHGSRRRRVYTHR